MRTSCKTLLAALAVATCAHATTAAADDAPPVLTGHIDLASQYVLRGLPSTYGNVRPGLGNEGADAPESDRPALQWGADYTPASGFYAGYWASMINYSYAKLGQSYDEYAATGSVSVTDFQSNKSIENDLYAGYNGSLGDFGYTVGFTGYVYINGGHSDALESKLGVSWKGVSLTAQTLGDDVVWGNKGDTYWSANYSYKAPYDLTLSSSLGWYTYSKEGKFLGTTDPFTKIGCPAGSSFVDNGCFAGNAPVGNAFRHLILGVSQPLLKTGITWTVQGILAGENRFGIKQGNRVVALLSYGF